MTAVGFGTAIVLTLVAVLSLGLAVRKALQRGLDTWLFTYAMQARKRRAPLPQDEVHLLLCIADHFEPFNGRVSDDTADARVGSWIEQYPRLFGGFRDSDGRPPKHTFFYPVEDYNLRHVNALAGLCREGYGEVEVHLHHDGDTAEGLSHTLAQAKERLSVRHGLLPHNRTTGELAFGFIHGNWALDNSSPDGRLCGVNNELDVLREAGCYADFTLPSFPSRTQTCKINSIYYATDDPLRPKSHDRGVDVGAGPPPADSLMLIQGPLVLNWSSRKWGILPRFENGCIQKNQPPGLGRLDLWLKSRIQVSSRPDWFFVKLHTHGAPEPNQEVLLDTPMIEFHRALARRATENSAFHFHYVTAREMYNLVRAAESGWRGSVADARDFELLWEPGGVPVQNMETSQLEERCVR